MTILKNVTEIQNLYTYFEFKDYDGWDEFDIILLTLTKHMGCHEIEKLEGVYSKHCILDFNGLDFKLMYHEDFGNYLCNQEKKDENYYNELECIAKEVVSRLNTNTINSTTIA
ncbi:MAG: hypothetical protein FWC91_14310 [Defluviitaleaceae bacterium]|nr:hypothetical protein [Defluviitaleaceae bacterium]